MQEKVDKKFKLGLISDTTKIGVIDDDRKVLPICFLCNLVPQEGMRSGFFLKGVFICTQCEQEIISSNVEEPEKYNIAIAKLREILFKKGPGKLLPEPNQ
ncbi:MAG: hypothetical protein GX092_04490 [Clostridia bacterium]|jgi:hypothetical protein|nr:hypothetical protein [Clostridia bacterium]